MKKLTTNSPAIHTGTHPASNLLTSLTRPQKSNRKHDFDPNWEVFLQWPCYSNKHYVACWCNLVRVFVIISPGECISIIIKTSKSGGSRKHLLHLQFPLSVLSPLQVVFLRAAATSTSCSAFPQMNGILSSMKLWPQETQSSNWGLETGWIQGPADDEKYSVIY